MVRCDPLTSHPNTASFTDKFKDRLLNPTVLSVVSKDINLKTANMHYGHGVHAQISGIQCWRELMKYSKWNALLFTL